MKKWAYVKVDKTVIESLGGLARHKKRLVTVLNATYGYSFEDKDVNIYPDYFEFISPDGNEPTPKEKIAFPKLFMAEFSEFEHIKMMNNISAMFLYKPKESMDSEKRRRLYEDL